MKKAIRISLLLSTLIAAAGLPGCDTHAPGTDATAETAEIGFSGGSITVYNDRGYPVSISVPSGALSGPTNVTLTSLGSAPSNPVDKNLFAGVRLEPEGLLLHKAATLTVDFPSDTEISNTALAVIVDVRQSDLVLPIAEQECETSNGYRITGQVYSFSTYTVCEPTGTEIIDQVSRVRQAAGLAARVAGRRPDNCLSTGNEWQETYTTIKGLLQYGGMLMALGNEAGGQGAIDAAAKILDKDINSFLKRTAPVDPCGSYAGAANKYWEASMQFSVSPEMRDAIEKRGNELLDKCSVRFSLEFDYQQKKDKSNENEEQTTYGTVTCNIPYYDFFDGEASSIGGSGHLSYKYDYETTYNNAMGYKRTASYSGTIAVTCGGYTYVKYTDESRQQVEGIRLQANLHFKQDIKGTSCDTGLDGNTCEDFSSDAEYGESYDFPLENGYQYGHEITTETESVKKYVTLYILNMNLPGWDNDEPDTDCY